MGEFINWTPPLMQPEGSYGKQVEYKMRNGETDKADANDLDWHHCGDSYDIIAYRIVNP